MACVSIRMYCLTKLGKASLRNWPAQIYSDSWVLWLLADYFLIEKDWQKIP